MTLFPHRIIAKTNETRGTSFPFQRLPLNTQRFNSVLIHESFIHTVTIPALFLVLVLALEGIQKITIIPETT